MPLVSSKIVNCDSTIISNVSFILYPRSLNWTAFFLCLLINIILNYSLKKKKEWI